VRFDPRRYERELSAILRELDALPAPGSAPGAALDAILRKHPRDGKGFFSRSQILAGWRHLRESSGPEAEAAFARRLRLRPVRTQSGVTPVTLLTKPFPCPGHCVFCPDDARMPKSYLSAEPGAQRAAAYRFDPWLQTRSRLGAFRATGHPTDKVELIVLGGTWSAYPEAYQRWFTARCLDALNDFDGSGDGGAQPEGGGETHGIAASGHATAASGHATAASGHAGWEAVLRAQRRNERAAARCVGISFETRPDHVDEAEALRLRRLGATKVQLGVQSLSDGVLERNRRGHDVAATRRAFRMLRAAGFKIQAHWMPNLLGSSPEADVADFERLFADPELRPDELKVYPCSLVQSAELVQDWRAGRWRPYTHDELLLVLSEALRRVPRWCRVTRVVRDISSDDILVGNKLTNFREIAEAHLAARGERAGDIRAREIRGGRFDARTRVARATGYATGVGREIFLERSTPDDRLLAFLRLSLPADASAPAELAGCAVVRELHVYGAALPLGARGADGAQHRGLGTELLLEAAARARDAGYARLAIISAVGTRPYYRRHGFRDGPLYQHRELRGDP
jgi:elongator complex protein 3 (tRNA carboxymethyluridine synthase)